MERPLLIAAMVVAALIAGCGGDEQPSSTVPPETPAVERTDDWETGVAEPDDASDAAVEADRATEVARKRYLRLDDLAIQLDDAIGRAIDAVDSPDITVERADLTRLDREIHRIVNNAAIDTGANWYGGNLLASASADALAYLNARDVRGLISVQDDVLEGRREITAEAMGR